MRRKRLAVLTCAAAVFGVGANVALAGEVTGSGVQEDQNQGMSWCSFSGLNDQLEGPTGQQAQSFGQELKLGLQDPRVANPGFFCNPNLTPLGPNPNRDK